MGIIVSVLIVAFCLYLVVTPLLREKDAQLPVEITDDTDEISIKSIYATLNELEMDYHMKKLSDEDYQKLKAQYERIAAELLEEQKQKSKKTTSDSSLVKEIEAEIEEELAKLRKEREGK
ncbi:c-type cytochrome biogenesis protein CcmI [Anaerobacillus alkaliphilus]|nr:c-type cytochrome biogenesis protein CcmI [Anaerobacillus alkaliphilus]